MQRLRCNIYDKVEMISFNDVSNWLDGSPFTFVILLNVSRQQLPSLDSQVHFNCHRSQRMRMRHRASWCHADLR